jgi:hypothetical protein
MHLEASSLLNATLGSHVLFNNGNSKFFFLQDQATERKRNLQSRGVSTSIDSLLSPSLVHLMRLGLGLGYRAWCTRLGVALKLYATC